MSAELLLFSVDSTLLAVQTPSVREVLRAVQLVPLAQSSHWVEGAINLRGKIVPVVDARLILSHPPRTVVPEDYLIILQHQTRTLALRVDQAIELITWPSDQAAQVVPGAESDSDASVIPHMITIDSGPVFVLDVDRLFQNAFKFAAVTEDIT